MKLFNKLRFSMIEGKRLKNYLIYALGEIILVVLGIMIALGINDWKSENADKKELNRIIHIIEEDLEYDLKVTNQLLNDAKAPHELITKILYDASFKDSIRNCEDCRYLMTQGNISNFSSKGYELLAKFNKEVKSTSKYADSALNFYSKYDKAFFQFQNKVVLDEIVDNMRFLRNNFSWYSDYYIGAKCDDDCLDYFESSDYINRLTYYEALFFDNYLYTIEHYKKDTERILKFLKSRSDETI